MGLLGIKALRPPKNAVHPDRPDFANYDEAKANPYPDLPPLLILKDGSKVTTLAAWKKRRAEIKALFDEDVYGKYPAHIPGVTWKVTRRTEDRRWRAGHRQTHHRHGGQFLLSRDQVQIAADVVTPAATKGKKVPVIIGGGALTPRFSLNGPDPILHIPGSEMCIMLGPQTPTSSKQLLERGWGFVSVDVNGVQADNARWAHQRHHRPGQQGPAAQAG